MKFNLKIITFLFLNLFLNGCATTEINDGVFYYYTHNEDEEKKQSIYIDGVRFYVSDMQNSVVFFSINHGKTIYNAGLYISIFVNNKAYEKIDITEDNIKSYDSESGAPLGSFMSYSNYQSSNRRIEADTLNVIQNSHRNKMTAEITANAAHNAGRRLLNQETTPYKGTTTQPDYSLYDRIKTSTEKNERLYFKPQTLFKGDVFGGRILYYPPYKEGSDNLILTVDVGDDIHTFHIRRSVKSH